MLQALRNFQNIAGVAVLLKCLKRCSVLNKKYCKCCENFQKKNVANAAELFKCCRDINKRFQMFEVSQDLGGGGGGEFPLLHLCVELIGTICSLLCHLSFAVAVLSCNCEWAFARHKLGS